MPAPMLYHHRDAAGLKGYVARRWLARRRKVVARRMAALRDPRPVNAICRLVGHRFWRQEQTSPWTYSRIWYSRCTRCSSPRRAQQ